MVYYLLSLSLRTFTIINVFFSAFETVMSNGVIEVHSYSPKLQTAWRFTIGSVIFEKGTHEKL